MSALPPLRAAVIGGGLIGALMDKPGHTPPLTHAGAYLAHTHFELLAICDPEPSAALQGWPCHIYHDLDEMLAREDLDIISVAVPKEQQPAILLKLLAHNPKAVIAEKPLAPRLTDEEELLNRYRDAGIPLLVNLPRRYSAMYRRMAERFFKNEEKVLTATIYYAKGLLHNGIHALDLAHLLFGDVIRAIPLASWPDFSETDPSISVFLEMEHCRQLYLQALDDKLLTLFEIDIITDQGRYVVTNDHRTIHISKIKDNTGTPPGKRLVSEESIETDYTDSFMQMMDNAYAVIIGASPPLCDAQTAYRAHKSLEQILENARGCKIV